MKRRLVVAPSARTHNPELPHPQMTVPAATLGLVTGDGGPADVAAATMEVGGVENVLTADGVAGTATVPAAETRHMTLTRTARSLVMLPAPPC